ncbi:hypothetical protein AAC387_Pa12g0300 [Persea americana]
MDGLTACCCSGRLALPWAMRSRSTASRRPSFVVLASPDNSNLGHWDKMELKFGRLMGEDPKLTLAKIMGRKLNRDISYLDIEKSFNKNKGRLNDDVPLHGSEEVEQSNTSNNFRSYNKTKTSEKVLNLVRPIMKKGTKYEEPNYEPVIMTDTKSNQLSRSIDTEGSISHVTLRKPSVMQSDNIERQKSSKLEVKPNLFLKMRKSLNDNVHTLAQKDSISDVTLLKKPEPLRLTLKSNQESMPSGDSIGLSIGTMSCDSLELNDEVNASDSLQQNSLPVSSVEGLEGPSKSNTTTFLRLSKPMNELKTGFQETKQSDVSISGKQSGLSQSLDSNSDSSSSNMSIKASLQGKPQRFDPPMKQKGHPGEVLKADLSNEKSNDAAEIKQFQSVVLEEHADIDWTRVEELLQTREREEVELISCSSRGFLVSFGSLVGFLPYRDLGARWKFLAFESWLRKKGLDPSLFKQDLCILGNYEIQNKNLPLDSNPSQDSDQNIGSNTAPDLKVEDLLEEYDEEKTKFLSSFVGQRIKVSVVLADRNSRRLLFSGRPKEKEELVERKRYLMARLSIGDVVKCTIKKITYFGIFVEVEGVPALIHQSEVSWDTSLEASSNFRIGQTVEAKVHLLDFSLERITLSLKQIRPDPLMEALESLESFVGDSRSLEGRVETAQADFEWADVESLIKELQKIEGIDHVSKGRFFLSPGLAPTFQVYMASVFQNQYKLLARSGNKVQEVIVQASLDTEQMKAAILTCTNRVE